MDISMTKHLRPLATSVAVALVLGVVAVALTGLGASIWGVPNAALTREPQVVLDGPAYAGLLSNLGAVVWGIPMVAAAVAAAVLGGRVRGMFAGAAVISFLLLADDLFLLHDVVYPQFGLGERPVQLIYLILIGTLVLRFRRELGFPAIVGIAGVVGFWGLSSVLDKFFNDAAINLDQLAEDGAKFVGIALWAAVWTTLAILHLGPAADQRTGSEPLS